MSGGGQAIGQSLVNTGMGGTAPTTPTSGAPYTPVKQGPVYQPQYQQYQQYQPQARAAQPQQQMPNYQSGLQAAMMHMMQQYNRPMMRAPLQQGLSPSSPLAYRPSMPTQNLNRVAPSVELQQRQAAEEAARRAAEQAAYDAEHPQPIYGSESGSS
jgi:hypothetical protein